MFASKCGHVLPQHGGPKFQFGDEAFYPGQPLTICQTCQQVIPLQLVVAGAVSTSIPGPSGSPSTDLNNPEYIHYSNLNATDNQVFQIADANYKLFNRRIHSSHATTKVTSSTLAATGIQATTRTDSDRSLQVSQDTGKSKTQGFLRAGSSGTRSRKRKNAVPSTGSELPKQPPPPTEIPNLKPKYCLKLITSHVDTPFAFIPVPDTEEWEPTNFDLGRKVSGFYLQHVLFEIIQETGLWDSFCKFNHCMLYCLDVLLLIMSSKFHFYHPTTCQCM